MFRYREERGWDNSNIKEQSMVKCFRRCWPLLKCFHVYIHLLPFGTIHKGRHQSGKRGLSKIDDILGHLSNVDVCWQKKGMGVKNLKKIWRHLWMAPYGKWKHQETDGATDRGSTTYIDYNLNTRGWFLVWRIL